MVAAPLWQIACLSALVAASYSQEIRHRLVDHVEEGAIEGLDLNGGEDSGSNADSRQLTVYITSAATVTQTIEMSELCAKLVNISGACRRRRGRWLEEPIVMSFDDNMDVIDQLLVPRPVQV